MPQRASTGRPDPTVQTTARSDTGPVPPRRCALRSGRSGGTTETRGIGQWERLIEAFATVVAANGYPRTTIGQVTSAAGLPEKAFHAHFADLEDCFLAAYRFGTGALLRHVESVYRAEPSWHAAIRSGLRVLLEWTAAEPAFARMSLVDAGDAGPRVQRARLAFLARLRSLLIRPDIPQVPKTIRNAVVAGVYMTVYNHVECHRTAELPELAPAMTDFMLLMLGGGRA